MRSRPSIRETWALAIILLVAVPALASAQLEPGAECLTYDSAYESAPLFEIKADAGQQRVYLFNRTERCPGEQPCASRQKSFLVAGDVVFAGPPARGFRCAYYGTAKGKIVAGFVPIENLESLSEDNGLSQEFVTGSWAYDDDTIAIKPAGSGQVAGEGHATYQTATTINEGDFSGQAPIQTGQKELVFKDGEGDTACIVTLRRRGPYLIAEDNSMCGGMNVRFNGIYTRVRSK